MNKLIEKLGQAHELNKLPESISYRVIALKKFKQTILKYEDELLKALNLDLGKNKKEAFLSEVNESLEEIDNHLKNIKKWSKSIKVNSTYQVLGTKSYIIKKPKGKVLLIVPFNYPVNLCFLPLIGAISAGNKVLIKMSSLTQNTNQIVKKIIEESFEANHVKFLHEKLTDYDDLFDYKPNMVFFTGSTAIGKKIESICVKNNIDYITELGGECPCVVFDVFSNAIYDRIVWAKFLNGGQTCVSINYILYNKSITNFKSELISAIERQYPNALKLNNIPKLINKKAFEKMVKIINDNKSNVIYGGKYDEKTLRVEPTIIEVKSNVLHKYGEIFGPILLISPLDNDINEYISLINDIDDSPLAAYIYSQNKDVYEKFINEINAGGYCVNDSVSHITNHHLPFGGVYTSGSGQYHGSYSFDAFSFRKPILLNFKNKNVPIKFSNNNIDINKAKKTINMIKKFKH